MGGMWRYKEMTEFQRTNRPTISTPRTGNHKTCGGRGPPPPTPLYRCITQHQSLESLNNLFSMSNQTSHLTLALASFRGFFSLKCICHYLLEMLVEATHKQESHRNLLLADHSNTRDTRAQSVTSDIILWGKGSVQQKVHPEGWEWLFIMWGGCFSLLYFLGGTSCSDFDYLISLPKNLF